MVGAKLRVWREKTLTQSEVEADAMVVVWRLGERRSGRRSSDSELAAMAGGGGRQWRGGRRSGECWESESGVAG